MGLGLVVIEGEAGGGGRPDGERVVARGQRGLRVHISDVNDKRLGGRLRHLVARLTRARLWTAAEAEGLVGLP